jgi:hypothetical protein
MSTSRIKTVDIFISNQYEFFKKQWKVIFIELKRKVETLGLYIQRMHTTFFIKLFTKALQDQTCHGMLNIHEKSYISTNYVMNNYTLSSEL